MRQLKLNVTCLALLVAALGLASPAVASTCALSGLVHIVMTNVTPGLDPTSFSAQPKVYYRIGNGKFRLEEAVDTVNGIHGIIVVSEPNIWMANLYDGTGKHIVDPGSTFFAKAPIFFGIQGLSPKLTDLELGCEADFIAANAPNPVGSEQIGTDHFDVYRVSNGSQAVEILERPGSGVPVFARYYKDGKLLIALRYLAYETNLPDDPSLFIPPPNIRYVDVGQTPGH